jgi:hypothetical protein
VADVPSNFFGKYFDPNLDLRMQAFNLLAFAGMAAGIIAAAVSFHHEGNQ